MKMSKMSHLLAAGLILAVAMTGCHKRLEDTTNIPASRTHIIAPTFTEPTNVVSDNLPPTNGGGFPIPNPEKFANYTADEEIFKAYTIHFAFDSSVVRKDDKPKAAAVAAYLKGHAGEAVRIAGHCDERGTAEYNRSLGERRALALREELVRLGIDPNNMDTISYGFDRPVDTGHNEAAWSQNRRGEFILLTPPKAP